MKTKYQIIQQELEKLLKETSVGDRFPSDRELAKRWQCNVLTVRKALAPLVQSGRIVRYIGAGSFVASDDSGRSREILLAKERKVGIQKGNSVGIWLHANTDSYGMMVLRHLYELGKDWGVKWIFGYGTSFNDDWLSEMRYWKRMGCKSIILPWFPWRQVGELASKLSEISLPVALPVMIPGWERYCFESASIWGKGMLYQTQGMVYYLYLLGCEQIVLIGPDNFEDQVMQQRMMAYTQMVNRLGVEHEIFLLDSGMRNVDEVANKLTRMMKSLGIIAHDDFHGLRLMVSLQKLGYSAPKDFRILGCNDTIEGSLADPPLTSIKPDYRYSAYWLLAHAIALASGQLNQSQTIPSHILVVRDSCGGKKQLDDNKLSELKNFYLEVQWDSQGEKSMKLAGMDKKKDTIWRKFTLVELLIVIVILTILSSLLLPVLGTMRAHGKKITCVNLLRQLGMVNQMYADSYDDYCIPPGNWDKNRCFFNNSFLKETLGIQAYHEGTNWSHIYWPKNMLCPSAEGLTHSTRLAYQLASASWGVNTQSMHPMYYVRKRDIFHLSGGDGGRIFMLDHVSLEAYSSTADPVRYGLYGEYGGHPNDPVDGGKRVAYRHLKQTNGLCYDGHVESFSSTQIYPNGDSTIFEKVWRQR